MEMDVQCKTEDDKRSPNFGHSYFAVSFSGFPVGSSGPGFANRHKRIAVSHPEDLKKLTFDNFNKEINASHIVLVNLDPDINLNAEQTAFAKSKNPEMHVLKSLTAAAHAGMSDVFDCATKNPPPPPEGVREKMHLLNYLRGCDSYGRPLLIHLIKDSQSSGIIAYANLIKSNKENLSSLGCEATNLLIGNEKLTVNGNSFKENALSCAVSNGQSSAIRTLITAYKMLEPSEAEKTLMIESISFAMCYCVTNGNTECYSALLEGLKSMNLSPIDLCMAIYSQNEEVENFLSFATKRGSIDNINLYFQAIKELGLASPETQDTADENIFQSNQAILMYLLGAGDAETQKKSALEIAIDHRQPEALKLICDAMTFCKLTPENSRSLLEPAFEHVKKTQGKDNELHNILLYAKDQTSRSLSK
jgi:hypothetical protein